MAATHTMSLFSELFGTERPIIGMIHLLPTPGYPNHPGVDAVVERAVADALKLEAGGIHGALIENDSDQPHTIRITPEQQACMTEAAKAVRAATNLPCGVGVLLNDWKAALDIATAADCTFVRVDVFVDRVSCDAGVIEAEADTIVNYRDSMAGGNVKIFADIQVKHKTMLDPTKSLAQSAHEAATAQADAIIVSGDWTGEPARLEDLQATKDAELSTPLLIGSGATVDNIATQLTVADGAIVGTYLQNESGGVRPERVQSFMNAVNAL